MKFAEARLFAALLAVIVAASTGCAENTTESSAAEAQAVPSPEVDEVNLDLWLERLEVGSRELYSAKDAVVDAVGLGDGDHVADIGSGTGLYSLLFADRVGATGHVFAEDIEPLFLDLVVRRAADADLQNISAVLGREDDVTLPADQIDVVFIADTYHYFDDREAVMRSIFRALKPGGRLILVEFEVETGVEQPDYKSHVRFGKTAVIDEIKYVGFQYIGESEVDGLDDNYFITFIKPSS